MTKTGVARVNVRRREEWDSLIAAQKRSGLSVKQFCAERGFTEQSFYFWRKRLRQQTPMRFALVETGPQQSSGTEAMLEIVLPTGERLRFGAGVNATALRLALEALRA